MTYLLIKSLVSVLSQFQLIDFYTHVFLPLHLPGNFLLNASHCVFGLSRYLTVPCCVSSGTQVTWTHALQVLLLSL